MATIEIASESELQARSRLVSNLFKDRQNCIVLKVDTYMKNERNISPFGFHFELDKDKYKDNKKRKKREERTKWLAWVAYIHHKLGIRHLMLILLMTIYVVIGGSIFRAIEADQEIQNLYDRIDEMDRVMTDYAEEFVNIAFTENNATNREFLIKRKMKVFYKTMLNIEGKYGGSVWHKAENLDLHLVWSFSSAIFYSLTIFTTIGYGTIVCDTWLGRWMTCVYAAIGIPLMLLVLGDLGGCIQRAIARLLLYFKSKTRRFEDEESIGGSEEDEDEDDLPPLPVWLAFLLIILFLTVVSLFVYLSDTDEFSQPGIDFPSSVYFVFMSFTTIGFGDVMPYHIQYSPVLALAFVLGLTLVSIINSSIYAEMYSFFYIGVTTMEGFLDGVHKERFEREGHKVFKDLAEPIKTLALSFPKHDPAFSHGSIPDVIIDFDDTKYRSESESAVKVRRMTSGLKDNIRRMRAPTLGALGGWALPPRRTGGIEPPRRMRQRTVSGEVPIRIRQRTISTEIPHAVVTTQTRLERAATIERAD